MDGEDGVAAGRRFVEAVISRRPVLLSFEEAVESFFLILAVHHVEPLYVDFALVVILNGNVGSSLLMLSIAAEHVKHQLVVNFDEGDFNSDLVVETATDF